MAHNQFPTEDQIQRRFDQIIEGIGYPHLPALPNLAFRRLTLAEKGAASRAFSACIKEEMAAGVRFSEPFLPTEIRRRCLEVGLNYDDLMAQEDGFIERIRNEAPADLRSAARRLTDEEIAALPDETRKAYLEQLRDAGVRMAEFLKGLFTPEEQIIRAQIEQVKRLRTELTAQSYEHIARIRQVLTEILAGARRTDDLDQPYFCSLEELYEIEDSDRDTWLLLAHKWGEFKQGKWPGFTRRSSSTASPGSK